MSTRVVRRISTKAIVHSIAATTSPAMPIGEEVISCVTPGEIALISRIVPPPIAATT